MNRFEAICSAMSEPSFYPHPVSQIRRFDTHISTVFLTGRWAYKLKKPLNFDFLDFQALASRKKYCEMEVSLNQRLSEGIYKDVLPIYETDDTRFSFKTLGKIAEYAVRMKQLPETASLRELLLTKKIRRRHLLRLGRKLAAFYDGCGRSAEIDRFGSLETISQNMEENFSQLLPYKGSVIDKEKWDFISQVSRTFLHHHEGLFEHRIESGRIRDGHGDLRTDHVYFFKGIQIIDCIEFNDRFRYGDTALDMAFLHMDMEHLGFSTWSRTLLNAYVEAARDPRLYLLIDFYSAYRAIVRMKVACFSLEATGGNDRLIFVEDIRRYLDQAYQYAIRFGRPTIWAFCGLPGTGKSVLSSRLSEVLMAPIFISDAIRKRGTLNDSTVRDAFGKGIYTRQRRQRVYAQMLASAQECLRHGRSVILDATFSRRKWREEVRHLAQDLDTNLIFIECVARRETLRARLKRRENESGLSDARWEHLEKMSIDFEPLTEIPAQRHIVIRAEQPPDKALVLLLSEGYARKCDQVKTLAGPA